jgi:ubiquinone/menaquinone biosynthesis C-methylase UbiE
VQGSALDLPFPSSSFDFLYAIGSLHHTGNLRRSVAEVHRVLRPGGKAVVMVYNRHSARQLHSVYLPRALSRIGWHRAPSDAQIRAQYDTSVAGDVAPYTDFTTRREAAELFSRFSSVRVDRRNFDHLGVRGLAILSRAQVLRTPLPRWAGLDLYVTATK